MPFGYKEGTAFGLFVLFGVLVVILTVGEVLPVLVWWLIITAVVVTCLVTVYRCVQRQATSLGSERAAGISTISNGRNGVIQVTEPTRKISKKDAPPAYATVTSADSPPPSYAALVHTFKTPAAVPVKKSAYI